MVRLKCEACDKAWFTNNKPWTSEKTRLKRKCIYCQQPGHMIVLVSGRQP